MLMVLVLINFDQILLIKIVIKKAGKWVPFCCTLGGGVDLGLGITYEELCIKFSSILIGPKKFYRHFKKKFSEKLKISAVGINRYLTRFCKNLNFKHIKFFCLNPIFEEKFMENLVPNFQNLVIKAKIFTIFQPQNDLQIFAILTYFKPCIKFSRFSGQPKIFLSIYDLYFLNNNKYLKSFEDKSLSLRDFFSKGKEAFKTSKEELRRSDKDIKGPGEGEL
ncbi:hypothetical protein AGLY_000382 [Aphis glycines]|uniref:Uncharacterized protein n=1 Tax=Aphis glycines TaxID=307491 RepID=A0A6G0U7U4_APHGL|nr:hypothetical protein AGLY_000382 [Aphis glycines]